MGYFLYCFTVRYKVAVNNSPESVTPILYNDREAYYNVSAPNKGTAVQEVERAFSGHKDLTIILDDSTTVHCAIQVVRWGLGADNG